METDNCAGEIVLYTMRGIASINEIVNLEQCGTLVLITPNEHAIGIVAEDGSINHDGEVGRFG